MVRKSNVGVRSLALLPQMNGFRPTWEVFCIILPPQERFNAGNSCFKPSKTVILSKKGKALSVNFRSIWFHLVNLVWQKEFCYLECCYSPTELIIELLLEVVEPWHHTLSCICHPLLRRDGNSLNSRKMLNNCSCFLCR